MDDETKKAIQDMINFSLEKSFEFQTRKIGDTPTDANQLVPKNYVDDLPAYAVRTHQSSASAITQNAWSSMTFQVNDFDPNGLHSTSTNISRITIKVAGVYCIGGQFMPQSTFNELGEAIRILVNGSTVIGQNVMTGDSSTVIVAITNNTIDISTIYYLNKDDYIEIQAASNFGGALNTSGDANTFFWAYKIGT